MFLTCLQDNLTEDNLELKMRVQVLEKENSLLSQEKVGAIKMGAELQGVCIIYRSQLRASLYQNECLVLESPEGKADVIGACQARLKYWARFRV